MSRQIIIAILATLFVGASLPAFSQSFTQLGMMSGSGQVFMPTNVNAPTAQFRLQIGRIGVTKYPGQGMNMLSAIAGFSPFLEGYVKFTSEQVGVLQSVSSVGVGAKFTLPFAVPLVKVVSFWGETLTTPGDDRANLYTPNLSRGAMIVTPYANGIRPSLLAGVTRDLEGNVKPMEGASVVVTTGSFTQWGIEYLHGYNSESSHHVMLSGVVRVLPYVSINIGPGYISSPGLTSWIWSAGVSFNSAEIDFKPVERTYRKGYQLPTIEELEKGSTENNPQSSEDKTHE